MTREELKELRQSLNFDQAEMGLHMGLSRRQYQDIETGASPFRPIHEVAAKYVSLWRAVELEAPMKADAEARRYSLRLARQINGE